ncbi:MAG: hypothetical protein U0527_13920 [Candidatus Eisenbacteria bacterium]
MEGQLYDFAVAHRWDRGNARRVSRPRALGGQRRLGLRSHPQYAGLSRSTGATAIAASPSLGFPANEFGQQEPGTNEGDPPLLPRSTKSTFPMYAKIVVKGRTLPALSFLTAICPEVRTLASGTLRDYLVKHGLSKERAARDPLEFREVLGLPHRRGGGALRTRRRAR